MLYSSDPFDQAAHNLAAYVELAGPLGGAIVPLVVAYQQEREAAFERLANLAVELADATTVAAGDHDCAEAFCWVPEHRAAAIELARALHPSSGVVS